MLESHTGGPIEPPTTSNRAKRDRQDERIEAMLGDPDLCEQECRRAEEALKRARWLMDMPRGQRRKPDFGRSLDVPVDPEDTELSLTDCIQIRLFGHCLTEEMLNDPKVADVWLQGIREGQN